MTQLTVPHVQQQRPKWCWAACIEMVLNAKTQRQAIRQCQLVNDAHGMFLCCTQNAIPQLCNMGLSVSKVATEWKRRSYDVDYSAGALPFADIVACIDRNWPFQVGLTYNSAIGHAVLVVGYLAADDEDADIGEGFLYVNDPAWPGPRWISYSALQTAEGQGGQWAHSWSRIR